MKGRESKQSKNYLFGNNMDRNIGFNIKLMIDRYSEFGE